MATAGQVLKAALQRILVQASEADLEPDEYQDAIFAMNNYMLALDADGVKLGYTEINNLSDTVTVPTGALRGVIANVAIEVAPDYGGQVTDVLAVTAKMALDIMYKIGSSPMSTRLPSTLPIGSGNEHDFGFQYSHFYQGSEDEILAETTGAISLESDTNEIANG